MVGLRFNGLKASMSGSSLHFSAEAARLNWKIEKEPSSVQLARCPLPTIFLLLVTEIETLNAPRPASILININYRRADSHLFS